MLPGPVSPMDGRLLITLVYHIQRVNHL